MFTFKIAIKLKIIQKMICWFCKVFIKYPQTNSFEKYNKDLLNTDTVKGWIYNKNAYILSFN